MIDASLGSGGYGWIGGLDVTFYSCLSGFPILKGSLGGSSDNHDHRSEGLQRCRQPGGRQRVQEVLSYVIII